MLDSEVFAQVKLTNVKLHKVGKNHSIFCSSYSWAQTHFEPWGMAPTLFALYCVRAEVRELTSSATSEVRDDFCTEPKHFLIWPLSFPAPNFLCAEWKVSICEKLELLSDMTDLMLTPSSVQEQLPKWNCTAVSPHPHRCIGTYYRSDVLRIYSYKLNRYG